LLNHPEVPNSYLWLFGIEPSTNLILAQTRQLVTYYLENQRRKKSESYAGMLGFLNFAFLFLSFHFTT